VWGRLGTSKDDADDRDAPEVIVNDDNEPFPTWSRLKSRMRVALASLAGQDQSSLNRFFRTSDPLDCAQLFRNLVGEANYYEFLRAQFQPSSPVDYWITPAHDELVALELPLLFTTNYDDLIEKAYVHHMRTLVASRTADDFVAHWPTRPSSHLVKIHGSIDNARTVVLTRGDYARARSERKRIYDQLRYDFESTAYLFVGFSLSDPNINILLDDARFQTQGALPPSFTVQGRYDPVTDAYYRSLGVNVIWIGTWDLLPSFLRAINPRVELTTVVPGAWPI
jgi:SIR2-like domain